MVDNVILIARQHLPVLDAERLGRGGDLLRRTGQPDQSLVESGGEIPERGAKVAFGINRDEQRLDVLGRRPDLIERLDHRAERRRALVRTMDVAEIDQQPFARKIARGDRLAIGIDEHQRMFERDPLLGCRAGDAPAKNERGDQSERTEPHLNRTPQRRCAAPYGRRRRGG